MIDAQAQYESCDYYSHADPQRAFGASSLALSGNRIKAHSRRDLTIVPISASQTIVIACDSCGAIGEKPGDILELPPRIAAKLTARVALTEVLCSGAFPIAITNSVSCEMNPTGEETIVGVREELHNAGFSNIVLNGSTEENFTTCMTALSITVVGVAANSNLKFGSASKGDDLLLMGLPYVGKQVDLNSSGFYLQIRRLLAMKEVKEIVPVGSKGVAHEAQILASLSGTHAELFDTGIDYHKSAGPATCLVILCDRSASSRIPGTLIGTIR